MPPLFVYGSLKEGFPNLHVNKGLRRPGEFRTLQPYPLYLIGGRLPCLLPAPGEGLQVQGQLFEVSAEELVLMDALERVGQPGGYSRQRIEVQNMDPAAPDPIAAHVYLRTHAMLDAEGTHLGPLALYTLEHARSLRW
jgi:gamma-glutamylaminecyclotransferase